jgi:hypothetical protein
MLFARVMVMVEPFGIVELDVIVNFLVDLSALQAIVIVEV